MAIEALGHARTRELADAKSTDHEIWIFPEFHHLLSVSFQPGVKIQTLGVWLVNAEGFEDASMLELGAHAERDQKLAVPNSDHRRLMLDAIKRMASVPVKNVSLWICTKAAGKQKSLDVLQGILQRWIRQMYKISSLSKDPAALECESLMNLLWQRPARVEDPKNRYGKRTLVSVAPINEPVVFGHALHFSVGLGEDYHLSKFGTQGPIRVTTTAETLRCYGPAQREPLEMFTLRWKRTRAEEWEDVSKKSN